MKIRNFFPRKKMRATTARRSLAIPDEMDYEEMSEPNMKLSRALLIVLVLHVIAVAGIIAFNTIKTRQGSTAAPAVTAAASPAPSANPSATEAASTASSVAKHDAAKTAHGSEKIIGKIGPKGEPAKRVEKAIPVNSPTMAKRSYVVEKGDTPLKIAKKFKVPFDDLMAANHIDDPHKLKVGQKLVIPAKSPPKAKKLADD